MPFSLTSYWRDFFSRNLFERIILYAFFSELAIKVIFELGLGMWYYKLTDQKQYLFFGLLLLDSLVSLPRIIRLKVRFNYITAFLLFFLFVILQGVVVGLLNHNRPFEIFNDSVPLLFIILNAFRMQSLAEPNRPVDVLFLLKACTIMGVTTCLVGNFAVSIGLPSTGDIGSPIGIYLPLLFAVMISPLKLSLKYVLGCILIIAVAASNINRTTILFVFMVSAYYTAYLYMRNPFRGLVAVVLIVIGASLGWMAVPEDSNTYKRITEFTDIDFSATKGSVGERGQEYRAITQKLEHNGWAAQMFGMGHGGLYQVRFTHEVMTDYGHAHYSWALFKLRYGYTGYVYLVIMGLTLLYHAWRNWDTSSAERLFVCFLCLQSLLYFFTYVNFVFLLSGLQFLYLYQEHGRKSAERH